MAEYNPKNFLILAVDDNSINRIMLEKILAKAGYQIKVLADSEEFLNMIGSVKPDLMLLDLMMPKIDGLELCRLIKAKANYKEVPIIFLTASDSKDNVIEAFRSGAVDYVTKPFNNEELLARIKTHIELKFTRDQLRKALVDLEKLATTDELTEIANRRHFLNLATREFNIAKRQKRSFSMIIFDIDHFKNINDNYGHPVGDIAIKLVAQKCQQSIRGEDLCARWGGEEFIVVVSDTLIDAAKRVANRIRREIASISLPIDDHNFKITVSVGIAQYQENDKSLDQIVSRADKALYRAKNNGRNQVVLEHELLDIPSEEVK
ncbi:response regulator receiver modulated diguanylate cyclase [Cyanobacterium stanieri PCC 7202]|uniref:Response regulator receiver modulated diguanylate cyclase n=1 Tax=Cyanobacterium stanieri (strain ATCC 29140 / PCC 7202) TaxID=292563 RepID=K9YKX8_CYASC|nr:response regulator receiver modulated diguanylate cyclase [Cyanobacterium stanieri PCC 7202]